MLVCCRLCRVFVAAGPSLVAASGGPSAASAGWLLAAVTSPAVARRLSGSGLSSWLLATVTPPAVQRRLSGSGLSSWLQPVGSVVGAHGLRCSRGRWHLSRSGLEPMCPTEAGDSSPLSTGETPGICI